MPARARMVTEGGTRRNSCSIAWRANCDGFCLVRRAAARTFLKSGAGKCMESVGIPIDFYRHERLSSEPRPVGDNR